MKRFLNGCVWMLLAALPLASCNDDDAPARPAGDLGELRPPVLSVSAEEVALNAEQADAEALTFSWTPASGAEAIAYELYLNTEGADLFNGGVKYELGTEVSHAFTHVELNDLVGKFGAKSGERLALHACVYARTNDDRIGGKASNEVKFAATAYEAVVGEPESLWMMGGACEFGWDRAIELPREADGTYEATGVELKFGKEVDNKGFKFYPNASCHGNPFYGQKIDGAFGEVQVFASVNDGDSQFYPLQHGYTSGIYTVRVDLAALQLTLTRTGDVEEFDPDAVLYILGDDMECGWDMVEGSALRPVGENIYEASGIRLKPTSRFKFDFHDWTEYIRDESAGEYWTVKKKGEDGGDVRFVPGDQNLEEGYYTVRVDLNTMKVTLTPEAASDYPRALYICGDATEAHWDTANFIAMTRLRDGVFQATGVRIDVGEANDSDNKGNGFKFIIARDWDTEYGAKESFEGESGYRGWELAQNGNQFYPLLMGCTSGTYTVTADLTAMTVTFEAE